MRCAYFVNMYPAPSHTAMRREVTGLRSAGLVVAEFTSRRFPGGLTEPEDVAAAARTTVLRSAPLGMVLSCAIIALTRPLRFARAMAAAISCGRRSPRGVPRHLFNLLEACSLVRACAGCDVMHAHFTTAATTGVLARMLGGPPLSLGLHGPEEFAAYSPWEWAWKARHAMFWAAVCEDTAAHARACLPDECRRHVTIVRCGLDSTFLADGPEVSPQPARFVTIARFEPRKRHDLLLDAFATLRESTPHATLSLVGDGPLRAQVAAQADRIGGVELFGWGGHATVQRELLRAACLVLPSDAEGLPIVIMESLAMRRPVIATDVGGVRELVTNGETGWLTPPGDGPSLLSAMTRACQSPPTLLTAMGARGRKIVLDRHDAARNMRGLVALWRKRGIGDDGSS